MPADVCLRVAKFSHATGTSTDNSIPWHHITASDLCVVLHGMHSRNLPLTMQVVHGTNILESLDVESYVGKALHAKTRSEQAGLTFIIEQLPIFGITKENLLALRYRLLDGSARRLQLRMQSTADCNVLVGAFKERGMDFQVQRPGTGRRPGTAQTSSSRPTTANQGPSCPSSALFQVDHHPDAGHASPHFHLPAKPSPFYQPDIMPGDLSRGSVSLQRPATSGPSSSLRRDDPPNSSYFDRGSTSPERPRTRHDGPSTRTDEVPHEVAAQRFLSRDETSAPREAVPSRPSTAQIYRSFTTPSQSQADHTGMDRRVSDPVGDRPTTAHQSTLEPIRESSTEYLSSAQREMSMQTSTLRASSSNQHWSSNTAERSDPTVLSSERGTGSDERPATARPYTASSITMPDTFEHEIPPRRELPFKRPDSKHNGSTHSGSRPSSSALNQAQSKKTASARAGLESPVKHDSVSLTKIVSTSRPGTASPRKRSFEVFAEVPIRPQTAVTSTNSFQPPTHWQPSPKRMESPPRPASPAHITVEPLRDGTAQRPSLMRELLARNKPLIERSANISRIASTTDAPHEVEDEVDAAVASGAKRIEFAAGSLTMQTTPRGFGNTQSVIRREKEADSLAEYEGQSAEDRAAALDEFMCDNLDNPVFATLCEDVQNCWRRMALGL